MPRSSPDPLIVGHDERHRVERPRSVGSLLFGGVVGGGVVGHSVLLEQELDLIVTAGKFGGAKGSIGRNQTGPVIANSTVDADQLVVAAGERS